MQSVCRGTELQMLPRISQLWKHSEAMPFFKCYSRPIGGGAETVNKVCRLTAMLQVTRRRREV